MRLVSGHVGRVAQPVNAELIDRGQEGNDYCGKGRVGQPRYDRPHVGLCRPANILVHVHVSTDRVRSDGGGKKGEGPEVPTGEFGVRKPPI